MPMSPQNVYVLVLTSSMVVLGDGTLGKQLGQENRDISNGANCLVWESPESWPALPTG